MLLDVGRYFFPVEFIKKYIDYMALHKMNYFHWHLTDNPGWRIEIKKISESHKGWSMEKQSKYFPIQRYYCWQ